MFLSQQQRNAGILMSLGLSISSERFSNEEPTLCLNGVNLFGEYNDLVLANCIFPILAFKDKNRLVPSSKIDGDEEIKFMVDPSHADYLPTLNDVSIFPERW